jgi:hypothetical protein
MFTVRDVTSGVRNHVQAYISSGSLFLCLHSTGYPYSREDKVDCKNMFLFSAGNEHRTYVCVYSVLICFSVYVVLLLLLFTDCCIVMAIE